MSKKRKGDDLDRHLSKYDKKFKRSVEAEYQKLQLAYKIAKVRQEIGMTQSKLAKLVGTSQPNIARIEDPNYSGHSLSTIIKIAKALDMSIDIKIKKSA